MKFLQQGDSALFVQTSEAISSNSTEITREVIARLNQNRLPGISEFVLSYSGFTIYFDPLTVTSEELMIAIESAATRISEAATTVPLPGITIPVAYGSDYGPDILHVAKTNSITPDEVVRIHCAPEYTVHMIGFTPGFPYLGGMSESIATPRKREPRLRVSAGSVGIAGSQTGIYPLESPGGWQVIGRTPLLLFDPGREPVFLVHAGMRVKFRAIDNDEFRQLCEYIEAGRYNPDWF